MKFPLDLSTLTLQDLDLEAVALQPRRPVPEAIRGLAALKRTRPREPVNLAVMATARAGLTFDGPAELEADCSFHEGACVMDAREPGRPPFLPGMLAWPALSSAGVTS